MRSTLKRDSSRAATASEHFDHRAEVRALRLVTSERRPRPPDGAVVFYLLNDEVVKVAYAPASASRVQARGLADWDEVLYMPAPSVEESLRDLRVAFHRYFLRDDIRDEQLELVCERMTPRSTPASPQ